MHTKFFRYVLSQAVTGIQFSKDKFRFVPKLDNYDLSNEELYKKYNLTKVEMDEIEDTIKDY